MMATRKEIVGAGITAVEEPVIDGDDLRDAILSNFEKWNEAFRSAGSNFGASTIDQFTICQRIIEHAGKRPYLADSPADFAKRILDLHKMVSTFIKNGDADQAARLAFEAGDLFARADMKWRWEKMALSGQKRADTLHGEREKHNRAVRAARKPEWSRWNEAATAIWEKNPKLSKTRVAELVKLQLNLPDKSDTISRHIKKVRTAR